MGALASYTISYQVPGLPGDPPVDIEVYIKPNSSPTFTLVHTEIGANPGTTYTCDFDGLDSHTVYQVRVVSICPDSSIIIGDMEYLSNPTCPTIVATPFGKGSLLVNWDCYVPPSGDSVIEYRLEYKNVLSPGPYFVETYTIADVLTFWATNPGLYPQFSTKLVTGIVMGEQYDIVLYITLQFDYYTGPTTTIPAQIPISCSIVSPVV